MKTKREQQQRLAIALGLRRKDGTPYTIGGEFAPPVDRLAAALRRIGYTWGRLTRDQAEDIGFVGNSPGEGESGHHWADSEKLSAELTAILEEEIQGPETVDGKMTLAWHIHQLRAEYYTREKIAELIGRTQ